jgi:hypothetical protein
MSALGFYRGWSCADGISMNGKESRLRIDRKAEDIGIHKTHISFELLCEVN